MLTVEQISKAWNISSRRVRELCSQGKIEGVVKVGRSYLIPDNAERFFAKKANVSDAVGDNAILIICADNNPIASAIAHNFFINDYEVYCNKKIVSLEKGDKIKKFTSQKMDYSSFQMVIFIDTYYNIENLNTTQMVYIGRKKQKDINLFQIIYHDISFENLTYHGKIFFSESGVLKEIYDLLQLKISNKINLPLCIEAPNYYDDSLLIKNFGSIQESYNFLTKQYESFDESDKYYTVAVFNEVEFSDSNQELNYLKAALNAIDRGVQANLVYIVDETTLQLVCTHFSTRLYLKHANNSNIYLISKNDLEKFYPEYLDYINEGIICYAGKSVYHDKLTEFSLGYVNAGEEDIKYCENMCEDIIAKSTKINTIKDLEEFYELHR